MFLLTMGTKVSDLSVLKDDAHAVDHSSGQTLNAIYIHTKIHT